MKAVILGATGLTGNVLLRKLISEDTIKKVYVISRRQITINSSKVEQIIIPLDQLNTLAGTFEADLAFSCLGTTIKLAGSHEAFLKVDKDYVLAFAQLCKSNKVSSFVFVSSIGAKTPSSNFYLNTKGEVEQEIFSMNFNSAVALRPSFLDGQRTENRLGEKIGIFIAYVLQPLLLGPLRKYRVTKVSILTSKMINLVLKPIEGNRIIENDEIIDNEN